VGKAPFLLVTKAAPTYPLGGIILMPSPCAWGFSPLAFVTKNIIARGILIWQAVEGCLPLSGRVHLYWQLKYYLVDCYASA